MCQLWEDVGLRGSGGEAGDIQLACMCGLDFAFVGKLDKNTIGGGDFVMAWVGNVEKEAGAASVGYGGLVGKQVAEWCRVFVTIV